MPGLNPRGTLGAPDSALLHYFVQHTHFACPKQSSTERSCAGWDNNRMCTLMAGHFLKKCLPTYHSISHAANTSHTCILRRRGSSSPFVLSVKRTGAASLDTRRHMPHGSQGAAMAALHCDARNGTTFSTKAMSGADAVVPRVLTSCLMPDDNCRRPTGAPSTNPTQLRRNDVIAPA
jgi:hypothetical protein